MTSFFDSAAGWFQVQCSSCTAALQVRLAGGETNVCCDLCGVVFCVKVAASDLPQRAEAAPRRQPRSKRKLPAALQAYNGWKRGAVKRLRAAEPGLGFADLNGRLAAEWRLAAENDANEDGGGGPATAAPAAAANAHTSPRRKGALRADDCGGCGKPVPWDRAQHTQDPRHKCAECGHVVHSMPSICMLAGATLTSLIAHDGTFYCSEVCRGGRM